MLIPPLWALIWGGAQTALTALAGGPRHFKGQKALAGALGLASTALAGSAVGLFRQAGTTPMPQQPDLATALVTDGVYGYTRNPMYLSLLLGLLAGSVASGRLRTLVAIPGMMLSLQPQLEAEEAALSNLFGADYEAYRDRVRRWL